MTNSPFITTRTFTLNLRGTAVEIVAAINKDTASIERATDSQGHPFNVTSVDLDTIEAALFESTEVEAFDFTLGRFERFTVRHNGEHIVAIFTRCGALVPQGSPQFTETAEAWHIDREWSQAVESDAPHAAALAGYLHPAPHVHRAGHGLRRAA